MTLSHTFRTSCALVAAITTSAGWAVAADRESNFAPVEPALFYHPVWTEYHQFVGRALFSNFNVCYPLAFCAMPSFEPEWGLFLLPDGDVFLLYVVIAPENLWFAGRFDGNEDAQPLSHDELVQTLLPRLKVIRYEHKLDRELGRRILQAWQGVLFSATVGTESSGVDGEVFYYFAAEERGRAFAGRRWTPAEHSAAGRLARLARTMRALAEDAPDSHDSLERALAAVEHPVGADTP